MPALLRFCLVLFALLGVSLHVQAADTGPIPFVMQMTVGDSDAQRRALLQVQKVMQDIGPQKVKIEVVAYDSGITSLLSDNNDTATLIAALAPEGVRFKACRISMRGFKLKDDDFPLEVEFVPAGAPEMVSLQMKGYRYWRP
jgi:intracellular sulfur oxidation DsrE/DsrF family protein